MRREAQEQDHLQQQWLALQQKQQLEQMNVYTPLISHGGHITGYLPTGSLEHGQHFSFPTPEEVARSQRLQWQEQQMVHNALIPVAMERQARPDEQVSHLIHPIANMEVLFQQQQLAALYGQAITSEALELQRQYETALQWIQKDPSLYQHQQVQQILIRYQQYQQQQQLAVMQLAMQQEHQQSRMMQELMGQQRDMSRPHPHDDHTPRVRPGVIVQPK